MGKRSLNLLYVLVICTTWESRLTSRSWTMLNFCYPLLTSWQNMNNNVLNKTPKNHRQEVFLCFCMIFAMQWLCMLVWNTSDTRMFPQAYKCFEKKQRIENKFNLLKLWKFNDKLQEFTIEEIVKISSNWGLLIAFLSSYRWSKASMVCIHLSTI